MSKLKIAFLFVLFAIVLSPAEAIPPEVSSQWNGDQIEWLSFDQGVARARAEEKPMLMVFHTTWCPHCARYRKLFFNQRVATLSRELVMVLVDRDKEPGVNARYGAFGRYIPRTMVLDASARLMSGIRGPRGDYPFYLDTDKPGELIRMMTRAAASGG